MVSTRPYGLPEGAKAVLLTWWHGISSDNPTGQARADRAVLRRASSLTAVACTPAYQRVYRDMVAAYGGEPWRAFQQERVAAVVALAAHVEASVASVALPLPRAMCYREDGSERNPVSELRFLRLLDSPDIESLFNGLRRTLPLIKGKVHLASLADDVFTWGDLVKKRWAYDYVWPKEAGG